MIGDVLSDCAADLADAVTKYYRDEFTNLPEPLRKQIRDTIEKVRACREAVDDYQATASWEVFNASSIEADPMQAQKRGL